MGMTTEERLRLLGYLPEEDSVAAPIDEDRTTSPEDLITMQGGDPVQDRRNLRSMDQMRIDDLPPVDLSQPGPDERPVARNPWAKGTAVGSVDALDADGRPVQVSMGRGYQPGVTGPVTSPSEVDTSGPIVNPRDVVPGEPNVITGPIETPAEAATVETGPNRMPPTDEQIASRKEAERAAADRQAYLDDLRALEPMTGDPVRDAAAAMRNQNVIAARDELGRVMQADLEGEQSRREASVKDQQLAEQVRVAAEARARNDRYRQQYEAAIARANQAVDDMVAATPDPDTLLGGKGSWGRALVLSLRANASSLGAPAIASLIDDHLKMEMESQKMRFEGAQARVKGLAEGARGIGGMVETFDKSDGMRLAALEKMAQTAIAGIAAQFKDPIQRAKMFQVSEKFGELALNKAQLEGAKSVSEIQKNLAEARRVAAKALGIGGGGTGVAVTPDAYLAAGVLTEEQIARLPKQDRERVIRIPGGGGVLALDEVRAREADKALLGTTQTVGHIDGVLSMQDRLPGWAAKIAGKVGWTDADIAVIRNELGQATVSAKEAYRLGALAKADMELIEQLGADPSQITKLWAQTVPVLMNWRYGLVSDAKKLVQQYGGHSVKTGDLGQAPTPPEQKSFEELIKPIGKVSPMKPGESIDAIAAALQAAVSEKRAGRDVYERLLAKRAEATDNLKDLRSRLTKLGVELKGARGTEHQRLLKSQTDMQNAIKNLEDTVTYLNVQIPVWYRVN